MIGSCVVVYVVNERVHGKNVSYCIANLFLKKFCSNWLGRNKVSILTSKFLAHFSNWNEASKSKGRPEHRLTG